MARTFHHMMIKGYDAKGNFHKFGLFTSRKFTVEEFITAYNREWSRIKRNPTTWSESHHSDGFHALIANGVELVHRSFTKEEYDNPNFGWLPNL